QGPVPVPARDHGVEAEGIPVAGPAAGGVVAPAGDGAPPAVGLVVLAAGDRRAVALGGGAPGRGHGGRAAPRGGRGAGLVVEAAADRGPVLGRMVAARTLVHRRAASTHRSLQRWPRGGPPREPAVREISPPRRRGRRGPLDPSGRSAPGAPRSR